MKDFRQLKVWEKSHLLALAIYKATMGSASETEYQLILARDLEFLAKDSYENLHNDVEEVKRMLASLLKTIRTNR